MNIRKMSLTNVIIICTVIAGTFALTVAILQIIKQINDAKANTIVAQKNEAKQKEISDLQFKLLNHSDDIIKTQQTVLELQKEINEKNKKIQELQNETLNNVTGGKSVPTLKFRVRGPIGISIAISNLTGFPIRNISIQFDRIVQDYFTYDSSGTGHSDNPYAYKSIDLDIGDLPIDFTKTIYDEVYPERIDNFEYLYRVRWLNGYYSGKFMVVKAKNRDFKITDNVVQYYSKGSDCNKAVYINGELSPIELSEKTKP